MHAARSVAGLALACASCFGDAPDVSPGAETGAQADASTGEDVQSTGTPTTSSSSDSTVSTSAEVTTSASSTGEPMTSDGTSGDAPASSSTTGPSNCHALDFDGTRLDCAPEQLSFPIGDAVVTFAEGAADPDGPCVEDGDDIDGWTAPLTGHYVYLQTDPATPATITLSAPAKSISFSVGPHSATPNVISICADTMTPCDGVVASADSVTADLVQLDLAEQAVVYIFHKDGTAFLGIDDVEVCFP